MPRWRHPQKTGPLSDAQLDELVRSGQLTPDALVWREGMAEWQPYGLVRSVPAPVAPGSGTARMSCALCSESFAPDEVIAFEGAWVCAACKPLLVQRVREGLSVGLASGNAWRDGDLVVTISGSTLTGRCVKCNGVDSLSHTSSTLDWHRRWVYVLGLLFPVGSILALLLLRTGKRVWLAFSICRHHRNQRSTWSVVSWLVALIACSLVAAAAVFASPFLGVVAAALLAGGAIALHRLWSPLSASKIEGGYVWLRGCGRECVDALPEFNEQIAMEQQNTAEPRSRKT